MNSKEEKDQEGHSGTQQEFEESMKRCEEQRAKLLQYLLDEERWHKVLHL